MGTRDRTGDGEGRRRFPAKRQNVPECFRVSFETVGPRDPKKPTTSRRDTNRSPTYPGTRSSSFRSGDTTRRRPVETRVEPLVEVVPVNKGPDHLEVQGTVNGTGVGDYQ